MVSIYLYLTPLFFLLFRKHFPNVFIPQKQNCKWDYMPY